MKAQFVKINGKVQREAREGGYNEEKTGSGRGEKPSERVGGCKQV